MDRTAAQAIIDAERGKIETIQKLFVDGRCPPENAAEARELLTRLKNEWDANLRPRGGAWVGTPLDLIMRQANAELSSLPRNKRPTERWWGVLSYVRTTLNLHTA